jgi:hypothetical protein
VKLLPVFSFPVAYSSLHLLQAISYQFSSQILDIKESRGKGNLPLLNSVLNTFCCAYIFGSQIKWKTFENFFFSDITECVSPCSSAHNAELNFAINSHKRLERTATAPKAKTALLIVNA